MIRFQGESVQFTGKKIISFLLLLTFTSLSLAQTGKQSRKDDISIDTVKFSWTIPGIDSAVSYIPQLRSSFNSTVIQNINQNIRKYFTTDGTKPDSADYIKKQFEDYNVKTLEEYNQAKQAIIIGDSYDEDFEIEHVGNTFINIGYKFQVLPYGGQYQFSFTSLIYDLRNGKKLKFSDFFSINTAQLIALFESEGYNLEVDYDGKLQKSKLIPEPEEIEEHMHSIVDDSTEDRCAEFYFRQIDGEMQLLFKFKCYGPQLIDFGIPLSKLSPYIIFPEFKNSFMLWGTDIYSLTGINIQDVHNEIDFKNYCIKLGGGYMISDEKNFYPSKYGIWYAHSDTKLFYLLVEYKNNSEACIVLDVLEVEKPDSTNGALVDCNCYTTHPDPEIIALVKTGNRQSAYYRNIIKAWRANRATGKFESIKRRQVKKCAIEGFEAEND